MRTVTLLLFALSATTGELQSQDEWDLAESRIRRLSADSFPGLPEVVREEMDRLGCLVPQASDLSHPHNVVSGRFANPFQVDWAFLCSEGGRTSLHVLWGGSDRCPTPGAAVDDRSFLQARGGDIGFSRRLTPVDRDRMRSYAARFEGPAVPDVWHQGIEDHFEGKASSVRLCFEGEWLHLSGID